MPGKKDTIGQFVFSAQDRLSQWYLARLRRRANQEAAGMNLTPTALIAVDKAAGEKLIVEKAKEQSREHEAIRIAVVPPKENSLIRSGLGILGIALLLQLALYAVILSGMPEATTGPARNLPMLLVLASCLWLIFTGIFLGKSMKRLTALKNRLLNLDDPIVKQLNGKDEIALLDYLFRRQFAELIKAREKERAIVEYSDEIVCSLDPSGIFTSVNPAPTRLSGYTAQELLGRPLINFILSEDREKINRTLAEARSLKQERSIEIHLRQKDGSIMDLFWSFEWSETAEVFFCVAHDISARKNIERMKQEFVSLISHDMRSPLSSIQGALHFLQNGALGTLNEKGKSIVSRAERTTNQVLRLINDLLDIDKIEEGKFSLNLEDCQLDEILKQASDAVSGIAEQKKITIELPQAGTYICVDSDQILRVLVNLLSNAIKFSLDEGSIKVEIEEKIGALEIRIRDQGRGIPMIDQQRIFDRFQQVDIPDAAVKGGSGLGLAICKAIIEMHGGSIGVNSEIGKGSVFYFQIPHKRTATSTSSLVNDHLPRTS